MEQRVTGFSDYDLKFDDLPFSDQYPYPQFENPNPDFDSMEPLKFQPFASSDTFNSSLTLSPEAYQQNPSLDFSSKGVPMEVPSDLSPNTFISSISWTPESDPFPPSSSLSSEGSSLPSPPLSEDSVSDPILKYLTEMLMEEDMDGKPFMAHDSLALQATEKSLNEVLVGNDVDGDYLKDYHQSSFQNPQISVNEFMAQNIFSDKDSVLQFQRGLEEARKFLPSVNQITIDPESNKNGTEDSLNESWGRKNHEREDIDLVEERSFKQPAVYFDESELSELFDKVLLFGPKPDQPPSCECVEATLQNEEANDNLQPVRRRVKRQSDNSESIDLRTLLILSAQAVSSGDRRTATELLKQIRQHCSISGDGSQRLAYYFANGLEARLAGTQTQNFPACSSLERISVTDILKAFHRYLSCCPFKKLAIGFAIKTIMGLSENAETVHIVDFGIGYGFQWPTLIWGLAYRPGGPPKLRITGIDLPQPGFRPMESINQTGRRLASYCERFKVPFEYNAIASQNWETIQLQDLKIDESETLFVNCLFRFHNLFDETVEKSSPRDTVLSLIKEMKPVAFIHSIVSGSYNSPFFVTRFREALFHYSALFDMFDTTVARDDQERAMYEREFYGREVMDVVSCEGLERIQRPETYKQWQARSLNAGLRQVPLDRETQKMFRSKLRLYGYHKDFVVDEASNWMLQGWKGRILFASSCWAAG